MTRILTSVFVTSTSEGCSLEVLGAMARSKRGYAFRVVWERETRKDLVV